VTTTNGTKQCGFGRTAKRGKMVVSKRGWCGGEIGTDKRKFVLSLVWDDYYS